MVSLVRVCRYHRAWKILCQWLSDMCCRHSRFTAHSAATCHTHNRERSQIVRQTHHLILLLSQALTAQLNPNLKWMNLLVLDIPALRYFIQVHVPYVNV
jgi:hypothetical protein